MGQYSLFAANSMTLGTGVQTDGDTSGNPSGYAGSRVTGSNGSQTGGLGGDIGAYGNVTLLLAPAQSPWAVAWTFLKVTAPACFRLKGLEHSRR